VTHGSRYSEKMTSLHMKKSEGYFLTLQDRILIYELISEKIEKYGIQTYTLNVLLDHVHIVCSVEEENIPELVRKIKG